MPGCHVPLKDDEKCKCIDCFSKIEELQLRMNSLTDMYRAGIKAVEAEVMCIRPLLNYLKDNVDKVIGSNKNLLNVLFVKDLELLRVRKLELILCH